MLKRKPIPRSEATPPKFFIPEQKGKVVYKAPWDTGATPPPPNIFKKDISPLPHLLFTRSNTHVEVSVSVHFLKPSKLNPNW